ncbi:MAG: nucleotide sugar dehydrogenase [Actinobacteria bacterium]|nr:nucleotide sugar dehydrogenase [Actinomycetota bacterium]
MHEDIDVVVVGGCGHVGLPLAIVLANTGFNVVALDIDESKISQVNQGILPFVEIDASDALKTAIADKRFIASSDASAITSAKYVVVVVGTPVDEHLNPDPEAIIHVLQDLREYFVQDQLIVLRSTVYPGVTRRVERWFNENVPGLSVAFCPERIAEGKAMEELYSLPQIIGARSDEVFDSASKLFQGTASSLIRSTPEEAELAKLFTNVWRYIKFATVNQFFMMANDFGVDFEKVRHAISTDYPRASDMPSAGFSAGPCLFKDTMQLGAFSNNTFALGHAAMLVNEGLPLYVVEQIEKKFSLEGKTIGILGMAFKANIDDERSSLSYKLRKILMFRGEEVLCSDPYVNDARLVSIEEIQARADVIVIGTPHDVYKNLEFKVPVFDLWNMSGNGVLI